MKIDVTGTGDTQDVNLFVDTVKPRGTPPPGLPRFDPNRMVSGLRGSCPFVSHALSSSHRFMAANRLRS